MVRPRRITSCRAATKPQQDPAGRAPGIGGRLPLVSRVARIKVRRVAHGSELVWPQFNPRTEGTALLLLDRVRVEERPKRREWHE